MSQINTSGKEILSKYRKAGRISKSAKKLAKKLIQPGENAYEIVEEIENKIRELGGIPAFPTNFSVNYEAAHYSPEILDTRIIGERDVIKLDLGVHIDGYIVDTAVTVSFSDDTDSLVNSTKTALTKAVENVHAGQKLKTIGKIIESTITQAGFNPIKELSGHQIKRYVLHAGVSVPNHSGAQFLGASEFESGKVYAIEPFASTMTGAIKESEVSNIFRIIKKPKGNHEKLNKIFDDFYQKVGILPFSPRFVTDKNTLAEKKEINKKIQFLLKRKIIMKYPVLIEKSKRALVSQHEHTVLVGKSSVELLT